MQATTTKSQHHTSQASSWDSHCEEASGKASDATEASSDLRLEGSNWESFHDGPGWLRFDFHLLAESHPHACLGGWLDAGLDPAKARDREDACLLHLRRGNGCQAGHDPCTLLRFHLILLRK